MSVANEILTQIGTSTGGIHVRLRSIESDITEPKMMLRGRDAGLAVRPNYRVERAPNGPKGNASR